ncbi:MAG TPA: hypothetical protein VGS23_07275 [Thermoplasmata archaeon]|nr:hypothetical protein [Thermoplasmata archaeon]
MMAEPSTAVANGDPSSGDLEHILVYRRTKNEYDRLLGRNISNPKKQEAILDVLKRERLIEKVKRRMIGVEEALESFASDVTSSERRIIGDSGQRSKVPSRADRRRRTR